MTAFGASDDRGAAGSVTLTSSGSATSITAGLSFDGVRSDALGEASSRDTIRSAFSTAISCGLTDTVPDGAPGTMPKAATASVPPTRLPLAPPSPVGSMRCTARRARSASSSTTLASKGMVRSGCWLMGWDPQRSWKEAAIAE